MRIKETKVFQFNELSDEAKEHARNWYREASAGDNYFSESVIEDAATIAALFGLDIRTRPVKLMGGGTRHEPNVYWSGFYSQGDGACFEGRYEYKADGLAAVTQHAPQDEKLLAIISAIQTANDGVGGVVAFDIRQRGHYQHSGCMEFTSLTTEDSDSNDEPLVDANTLNAAEETIRDNLRWFADWIYRGLESEYEYQNSDESVDETIRANEYEFTEEGARA